MSEGGEGASADSYIGSLISLTSKSDIRYEGVLYTVDTAESNIALQNVRSFGTEGRKKDGPQIPLSDKVYDFIIFRGSDIKDLQVKMSPPVRTTQPQHLHPDPAIISLQSQPSAMGAPSVVSSSTSSANTSSPGTNATAISTDMTSYASIPSVFRSNVPPLYQPQGSWAMPQVPQANMYWTGYYRPQVGIPFIQPQAQLQFQALPSMPLSYASLSRYLQPLKPTMAASVFPPTSSSSSMVQAKAADLPLNTTDTMTRTVSGGVSVAQDSTSSASAMETNVRRNTMVEASISKTSTGDESLNVVTTGTRPASSAADLALTSQEVKEPLLPLPANSNQRKATQVYGSTAYAWRGKGRCDSTMMFTEDFDFTAMNEKFNKHEVWGQLGRTRSSDKGDGEEDASNLHLHDAEEDSYRKAVYVKDDFFDTLSSDSGGQNEKMKYSEQRKVDSETFGSESVRSHSGRSIGYRHRGAGYRGRGYYGNRGDGNRSRGRNYARSPSFYY